MPDTTTVEGRDERMNEIVRDYTRKGSLTAVVRLLGGSINDYRDYSPADEGEPPHGEN